jgi:geranylgeranyl diphosphate synthase type I
MAQPADEVTALEAAPFLSLVDRELSAHLSVARGRLASLASDALVLVDELVRLVEAGGKRLRPLLCYWGHRAAGGVGGLPLARAGAAIELLHTSAIIHDDVMDRSGLRRGRPTAFATLGGSAAVLAGDLAQAYADELLVGSGFAPELTMAAFIHFNRMRVEAVSGEFMDLRVAARGEADLEEARARRIAALKSGSYSVVGPLLLGASLAGAGEDLLTALRNFGEPLGEAFQLRDDVLGTFGDPAMTGKDRDGDIRLGKRSTMVAKALRLGSPSERRLLLERLGSRGLSADEVEEVRNVIRGSGALAETIELASELAALATASLHTAPIESNASEGLAALANEMAVRDA